MRFLLVPHEVTDTTANIWVGVLGEDDKDDERLKSVSLEYSANNVSNEVKLDAQGWKVWKTWNDEDKDRYRSWAWKLSELRLKRNPEIVRTLNYQVITIPSLEPSKTYSLRLRVDSNAAASSEGQVATLPDKLPEKGQKPFTILLGSCFYGPNDTDGLVGATYHHIPAQQRPDIKILCGDQVYLDNPWRETTLPWYRGYLTPGQFRAKLLERYTNNWTQAVGDDAGFRRLLKDGANYFCSDDHEFWNNAPNFGGIGFINTLSKGQRCWWWKAAAEHFEALKRWIEQLRGPGVLVVGQPVLIGKTNRPASSLGEEPTKTAWSFLDKNLANYEAQYEELVGHIKDADHSVVVLTGDVHFGRVACSKPTQGSDDAAFVEVISSPMQLVVSKIKLFERAKGLPGHYRDAAKQPFAITESRPLAPGKNHFVTVGFSYRSGGKVLMVVRSWPIIEGGQ